MTFHLITISDMLNEIRDETYTTLQVQHTNPLVDGGLRVEVDTGAAGNTLPKRIYHQMFGNIPMENLLTPKAEVIGLNTGYPINCPKKHWRERTQSLVMRTGYNEILRTSQDPIDSALVALLFNNSVYIPLQDFCQRISLVKGMHTCTSGLNIIIVLMSAI